MLTHAHVTLQTLATSSEVAMKRAREYTEATASHLKEYMNNIRRRNSQIEVRNAKYVTGHNPFRDTGQSTRSGTKDHSRLCGQDQTAPQRCKEEAALQEAMQEGASLAYDWWNGTRRMGVYEAG